MKGEFYKMDYEAWDTGTVDLSLEVEGAYLRICHHMYRIGGPIPNSVKLLQGLFRCGHIRAAALLQKLLDAGKICVTEDGLLANNRVGRELLNRELTSTKRRVAGELGGTNSGVSRSKLLKNNETSEAIDSTLRTRGEERRRDNTPLTPKGAEPDRFPEFKAAYPKRSTTFPTTQARKRWTEAMRRGDDPERIVAGAKLYAAEQGRLRKVGTEYIQSADVWLNKRRWQDYVPGAAEPTAPPVAPISDVAWQDRVRTWRDRGGHWPWRGPPPDEPGTLVPAAVLAGFGLTVPQAAVGGR